MAPPLRSSWRRKRRKFSERISRVCMSVSLGVTGPVWPMAQSYTRNHRMGRLSVRMAARVCVTPGCPNRFPPDLRGTRAGRCVSCARQLDAARGTRQTRGYDAAYDAARQAYAARMATGERFSCWRCPELGRPGHDVDPDDWHLGHDVDDRARIRGPQCSASNLATHAGSAPSADTSLSTRPLH